MSATGNSDPSSTAPRNRVATRLSGEARVWSAAVSRASSSSTTTRKMVAVVATSSSLDESKTELVVLLADYRREAEWLGACPMSSDAIERAFELAALA